jgi:hypothetical protein
MRIVIVFLVFAVLFSGCSGLEQSEEEKLRRLNAKGEYIYRNSGEVLYPLKEPVHYTREPYPWEKAYSGRFHRITKDFFRCKGSSTNPPRPDERDSHHATFHLDCGGFQKHSLPLRQGSEFIYPILIDLMNYIQDKTGSKVVITCGHRCPTHNTYSDGSVANQSSKHMIGAEVDFYVQGMEQAPEKIVALIMAYYKNREKPYSEFQRLKEGKWNVSTPPWANKEIAIKLYQKHEGRDFDNRHPYPYIGIQVRFDPASNEKVICDWKRAFNSYQRY